MAVVIPNAKKPTGLWCSILQGLSLRDAQASAEALEKCSTANRGGRPMDKPHVS
jgi:hypothetical protein